MLGTSISSVTFLALPAAAFVLDWRQLTPNLMMPVAIIIAAFVIIPFFRRGRATSAFEYLEERFGPLARLYGAISFLIIQLIRIGTVLYLISLPIGFLLNVQPVWVIIFFGIFVSVYTVAGGIEAVIWTDVVQSVILIGGAIICLCLITFKLPEGFTQIIDIGMKSNKFSLGDLDFDLGGRTIYTMAILGIFQWLTGYSADQTVVQRYLAAKSMREARKATFICMFTSIPTWTIFFFVGTSLFVYYKVFPDPDIAKLSTDQIFPYFINTQVPVGISGLTIGAILAAAMSSLDSGINSITTIFVVDVMKRWTTRGKSDHYYLKWSRRIATIASVIMICGGLIFLYIPKESMVDMNLILKSVFGGCILAVFMLGFFTKRVDYTSLITAMVFSIIFNVYLGLNTLGILPEWASLDIHAYWVNIIVNIFCVVFAYVMSLIRNKPPQNLDRLTVFTTKGKSELAAKKVSD
jgi:SSS family solute:Na+ symporter